MEDGFIFSTADDPPVYTLAQAPEKIMVSEVLNALRDSSSGWQPLSLTKGESVLVGLLAEVEHFGTERLAGVSLREIATETFPAELPAAH